MRARPPFDPRRRPPRRRPAAPRVAPRPAPRARRGRSYRRWALLRARRDPLVYAARPLHDLPGGGDGDGAGWVGRRRVAAAGVGRRRHRRPQGVRGEPPRHPPTPPSTKRLRLAHWRLGAAPALADLAPLKPELEAAVAATSGGGGGGAGGSRRDDEGDHRRRRGRRGCAGCRCCCARRTRAPRSRRAARAAARGATALHARAAPLKVACARWLAASLPLARCRAFRSQLLALPPAPRDALAPLIAQQDAADDEALRARAPRRSRRAAAARATSRPRARRRVAGAAGCGTPRGCSPAATFYGDARRSTAARSRRSTTRATPPSPRGTSASSPTRTAPSSPRLPSTFERCSRKRLKHYQQTEHGAVPRATARRGAPRPSPAQRPSIERPGWSSAARARGRTARPPEGRARAGGRSWASRTRVAARVAARPRRRRRCLRAAGGGAPRAAIGGGDRARGAARARRAGRAARAP